jgi:uncharacterized protein YuzE
MKKYNFSYDKKNDDLFIYSVKSKSKGSVELGDVVLDFNTKKELVGIQLINASKFLKDVCDQTGSDIKNLLGNLTECKLEEKTRNRLLIIKLYLNSKTKEITPIISIPSIKERSPAMA